MIENKQGVLDFFQAENEEQAEHQRHSDHQQHKRLVQAAFHCSCSC